MYLLVEEAEVVVLAAVAAGAVRVPRPASAAPVRRGRLQQPVLRPRLHAPPLPPRVRRPVRAPVLPLDLVQAQRLDLAQEQPLQGLARVGPPRGRAPAAINSAAF